MEAYFVIVSNKNTMERVDLIDVAEYQSARDIMEYRESLGYDVSIWKGTRIYLTRD